MGDLVGNLFEKAIDLLIRRRVGRWVLIVFFALLALFGFTSFSGQSEQQAWTDVGIGIFSAAAALVLLYFTVRIGGAQRRAKQEAESHETRVQELRAAGLLLPIPALPNPLKSINPQTVAAVEGYAQRMASVPWGGDPKIAPEQANATFNTTVAKVRRVRGDPAEYVPLIDTFVDLPRPLSYVGAAEVMYRLSYSHWSTYVPQGLQQGLKFVASAQVLEPRQPDALVIRVKLLAGVGAPRWLELADQTLAILKEVAPQHPRLPDAEAAIRMQRSQNAEALASLRAALAVAPTPEDAFAYRANIAMLFKLLKQNDEALAAFDEVLTLDPRDAWTWYNKGSLLLDLGQYDAALAATDQALAVMDFGMARTQRERILAKVVPVMPRNEAAFDQA